MSKTTETEEVLEKAETPETVEKAEKAEAEKAGAETAEKAGAETAEKAEDEKGEAEESGEAEKPEAGKPEESAETDPEKAEAEKAEAEKPEAEKPEAEKDEADADGGTAPVVKTTAVKKGAEPSGRGLADRLSGGFATVLAVVALVVSLGLSAFLWTSYSGASEELDTQQQVRTRSAEFTRAFLLYDKSDLDGWEQRLTALAAPDYRSAISQAVKMQFPVINSFEASSQVTVRDVFVNDFDGTVAKAVVVADSQVTSKDFIRTATGMRLLLELTHAKGEWLVNGVGVLGIDNESMTDAEGKEIDPDTIEAPEVAPSTTP